MANINDYCQRKIHCINHNDKQNNDLIIHTKSIDDITKNLSIKK